jgi:hypothetical protein
LILIFWIWFFFFFFFGFSFSRGFSFVFCFGFRSAFEFGLESWGIYLECLLASLGVSLLVSLLVIAGARQIFHKNFFFLFYKENFPRK